MAQEKRVMKHDERPAAWSFIKGDRYREIEGTTEYPVMYRALGAKPATQHPFNLYKDILTEPAVLKATFEVVEEIPVENIIDTIGAGDAFDSGLITGYLEGMSLEEMVDMALTIASYSIQGVGGTEAIPYRNEIHF